MSKIIYRADGSEISLSEKKPKGPIAAGVVMMAIIGIILYAVGVQTVKTPDSQPVPPPIFSLPASPTTVDAGHGWLTPPSVVAPADMPETFMDGSHKWAIKYASRASLSTLGCNSFTDPNNHTVWLPSDATRKSTGEDLLHELMHASIADSGGPQGWLEQYGKEEQFINPSAEHLAAIFRDNPLIVRTVTGSTRGTP